MWCADGSTARGQVVSTQHNEPNNSSKASGEKRAGSVAAKGSEKQPSPKKAAVQRVQATGPAAFAALDETSMEALLDKLHGA